MTEPAVGIREVAEHLNVSTDTAYQWARLGKIPASKIGGVWRFYLSDVRAAVSARPAPWAQSNRSLSRRRVA